MTTSASEHAYIVASQVTRGGAARIEGTRITVADVVLMHLKMQQSLAEIGDRFEIPIAALHVAMSYYYDNQAAIDERIREDDDLAASLKERMSSPLSKELRGVLRGINTNVQREDDPA